MALEFWLALSVITLSLSLTLGICCNLRHAIDLCVNRHLIAVVYTSDVFGGTYVWTASVDRLIL